MGTRESLLRGGRLAAAASREYLHFQGFAYQGIAKADLWGSLLAGQVHVLQNGEAYEARRSGEYFFPKMHFPSLMLGSSLSCQNRVGTIRSCGRCWCEDVAKGQNGASEAGVYHALWKMLAGGRDGAVGRCVRMLQGRDGESKTGLRILLREDAAGEQRGPRTLLSIVLCEDREQTTISGSSCQISKS